MRSHSVTKTRINRIICHYLARNILLKHFNHMNWNCFEKKFGSKKHTCRSSKIPWEIKQIDTKSFGLQHSTIFLHNIRLNRFIRGRSRWGSGVRSNPPFEAKLFHFHGEFSEKFGENDKKSYKIHNRTPFVNLTPLSRNPGSTSVH